MAGAPGPTGEVEFIPDSDVVLGASILGGGTLARFQCRIFFDVTVLKVPTKDASALPGIQTNQLGHVVLLTAQPSGSTGFAGGSDTTTVTGPTLTIAKTPDGQTITAGDTATFTIVVTNTGNGNANAVVIDDTLPPGGGLTWGTATPGCTVVANVLHCDVGTLAPGASFTVVVTAQTSLQACTTLPNTATTSASNAGQVQDDGTITCQIPVCRRETRTGRRSPRVTRRRSPSW